VELDRLCRETAVQTFKPIFEKRPDTFLSININASILDTVAGSGHLIRLVRDNDINPGNVLLEIVESRVKKTSALVGFAEDYKNYGFMLGLDDVGSGHSNLNRIPAIKPHVIKVDKGLVARIDKEYHKQAVVRSLVELAYRAGAMVVAEGVERELEAVVLLDLGIDIQQGFYFAKPGRISSTTRLNFKEKMERVAFRFKRDTVVRLAARKKIYSAYNAYIRKILEMLRKTRPERFDTVLKKHVNRQPGIEGVYVLDKNGVQVTGTVQPDDLARTSGSKIHSPAIRGDDHSIKDYYMPIHAGLNRYTTDPYISQATGNICRTLSVRFRCKGNGNFILCLDIIPQ